MVDPHDRFPHQVGREEMSLKADRILTRIYSLEDSLRTLKNYRDEPEYLEEEIERVQREIDDAERELEDA